MLAAVRVGFDVGPKVVVFDEPADRIIEIAREKGLTLSRRQLAEWHRHGLIPNVRHNRSHSRSLARFREDRLPARRLAVGDLPRLDPAGHTPGRRKGRGRTSLRTEPRHVLVGCKR